MMRRGWIVLSLVLGLAPQWLAAQGLSGPTLSVGEELHYIGTITEEGQHLGNTFKKSSRLDIRLLVLEARRGEYDCALLTVVQPKSDIRVVEAVQAASGQQLEPLAQAAVSLELIRVDARGQVRQLLPTAKLPLLLEADTRTQARPALPLETPASSEVGFMVPLPIHAVELGETWDMAEPHRPPQSWAAPGTVNWNGRRCYAVQLKQQSEGYEQPEQVKLGWQRSENLRVSPAEGVAAVVNRLVVQRQFGECRLSIHTSYELQPAQKLIGAKLREARTEIETAWHVQQMLQTTNADSQKSLMNDIDWVLERNHPSSFRPALEAAKRHLSLLGSQSRAPAPRLIAQFTEVAPPQIGEFAPDFLAEHLSKTDAGIRLSKQPHKPHLLVFYKPNSQTSEETLQLCAALAEEYRTSLDLLPLAATDNRVSAVEELKKQKATFTVYDGSTARAKYRVNSFPWFVLIDQQGVIRWTFDAGIGPEVGPLLVKQLTALGVERPLRAQVPALPHNPVKR